MRRRFDFGLHSWRPMKYGIFRDLDCRECRRCTRFEIIAYGRWYKADRRWFPDVSEIEALPAPVPVP